MLWSEHQDLHPASCPYFLCGCKQNGKRKHPSDKKSLRNKEKEGPFLTQVNNVGQAWKENPNSQQKCEMSVKPLGRD